METKPPTVPPSRIVAWVLLIAGLGGLSCWKLTTREEAREGADPAGWQQLVGVDFMGDMLVYGGSTFGTMPTGSWDTEVEKLYAEHPGVPEVAIRVAAFRAHNGRPSDAAKALRSVESVEPGLAGPSLGAIAAGLEPAATPEEQTRALDAASALQPLWVRHALRLAIPACDTPREEAVIAAEAPARLGRVVALCALFGSAGCLGIPAFFAALLAGPIGRAFRPSAGPPHPPSLAVLATSPLSVDGEGEGPERSEGPGVRSGSASPPLLGWGAFEALCAIALFFAVQALVGLGARPFVDTVPGVVIASGLAFGLGGFVAIGFLRRQAGPGFWRGAGYGPYPAWKSVGLGMWGALALPLPMVVLGLVFTRLVGEPPMSQNPAIEMIVRVDDWWAKLAMFLLVTVGAPLVEETLFRGALFAPLKERLGPVLTVAISSVLFALAHLDFVALPQYILIGISLGVVRQVSGSIRPSMVLHAIWNGSSFVMLGLLTS
jgi:uncharacterized protein